MEKKTRPSKKSYKEEECNNLEIKNKEKFYLHEAFNYLCELEKEPSSDDNSCEKIYRKKIEKKVKEKRDKDPYCFSKLLKTKTDKTKTMEKSKKYKEDDPDAKKEDDIIEGEGVDPNLYKDPQNEEEKLKLKKFGVKAIRKVLKKLTENVNKNDIKLMIWEVDTDLDGFISFEEYERMYKRCVLDTEEREPKKLYYLVQFLMFDKEKKFKITVEDTLEILCVRNTDGFDNAINSIFCEEVKDEKGNIKKIIKDSYPPINYDQFIERMHTLSLRKRNELMNKKKTFCDKIHQDAINKGK